MRAMSLIALTLGLGACAGQSAPSASDAPPAHTLVANASTGQNLDPAGATTTVQPPAAPAVPSPPTDANLTKLIAEAKAKGYRLVNQNGQTMYCRTDLKTGSHLQKEITCLSEADLASLHDRTADGLRIMEQQQHPPVSH